MGNLKKGQASLRTIYFKHDYITFIYRYMYKPTNLERNVDGLKGEVDEEGLRMRMMVFDDRFRPSRIFHL